MTRAEVRRQRERSARAFVSAQVRTKTAFHVVLDVMPDEEREKEKTFATDRTVRDQEDRALFHVDFDPHEAATLTRKDLWRLAGHEIIHMILWDLPGSRRAHENACYTLQRALFGEVGDP